MSNEASLEIAQGRERFEKVFAEKRELDVTPNTTVYAAEFPYADIVTQDHFDCWQAAERDTRERCAQLIEREADEEMPSQALINAVGLLGKVEGGDTRELKAALEELRTDILSSTGTRDMTETELKAVRSIEAMIRKFGAGGVSPAMAGS